MSRDTGEIARSLRNQPAHGRSTCLDNPVIADHLETIRALGREYGVLRLEAFGSVCTPEFDPKPAMSTSWWSIRRATTSGRGLRD